jgi:hypothetical protein
MRAALLAASVGLIGFLSTGCAEPSGYVIQVNSINDHNRPPGKIYSLLPGNENTPSTDLQFREFAAYVNHILSAKGYSETTDPNKAETVIFLSYGVGGPKEHQFSYNVPVWGQTGVSSASTYGTINRYGNQSTFSGQTAYTPTFGVVGYAAESGTYVTYWSYMVLDAYDLRESTASKKSVQIWRTATTSTTQNGDLRWVFPVLAAATKGYVGLDTGWAIHVALSEEDAVVKETRSVVQTLPTQDPASRYWGYRRTTSQTTEGARESH